MKKLSAILLAVAMIFAFAACGEDKEPANTTTFNLFGENEETAALPVESKTEVSEPASSTAPDGLPSTSASELSSENAATTSEPASKDAKVSTTAAVKPASNGLNSTDIAEVVNYYNAAVKKTRKAGAPKGQSSMKLVKGPNGEDEISGDGAIGAILKILKPAAVKALAKNSKESDWIPGEGKLKPSDVIKAKAVSKNGVTTVSLQIKEQVDGSDASPTEGPVGRAIGTLGSIDGALKELGAELISGRETVKLTYKNAYIKCTINEKTGLITGGTWHHLVNAFIGNGKAKLGLTASLKNLQAFIDYSVVI